VTSTRSGGFAAVPRRSRRQQLLDLVTFPLRAVALFGGSRFGLSTLASERFDYVSRQVTGVCLDVGCGPGNRFVTEYLGGNGVGVDVHPYEGVAREHVLEDVGAFPFADEAFDHVTFIACLNHVPQGDRDRELAEAYRVLRPGGSIIVTMGHPLAEILVHRLVAIYDRLFGTHFDHDGARGMHHKESLYLHDREILERLVRAGFAGMRKLYFTTQWRLNHLIVGYKPRPARGPRDETFTAPSVRNLDLA